MQARASRAVGLAMHRFRLPIVSPCSRSLDAMPDRGEGRRWCDDCEQHVHDLSAMRESEALALLDERAGESICVAYRSDRRSGEVLFRDRAPRRLAVALALVSGCIGLDSPELELPDEPEPPQWLETTLPDATESSAPEPARLDLLVLGDGYPLVGTTIRLESKTELWTGASDAEGRWTIGELHPGRYFVHVEYGDLSARLRVDLRPGESSSARVNFVLPELRVIIGEFDSHDDAPRDNRRLPVAEGSLEAVVELSPTSDRIWGGISLSGDDRLPVDTVRTLLKHARARSLSVDG